MFRNVGEKMKKLFILAIFYYCSFSEAVLPSKPGSCKKGEVNVAGKCVSKEINLKAILNYLNEDLNLNVSDRDLEMACNEYTFFGNRELGLKYLKLDRANGSDEDKLKVLKAVCDGLNSGFRGPVVCRQPGCPPGMPDCTKNDWIFSLTSNPNYEEKTNLYGECPLF